MEATASIIAVLQLSAKVIQYTRSAVGSKEVRTRLREEIRACKTVLEQLKDEADDSEAGVAWTETIKVLERPDGPLSRLKDALELISRKLERKDGVSSALVWPLKEKQVQEIVNTMEREKALLMLAVQNNSRKLLQEVVNHSKEGSRQLEAIRLDLEEMADSFTLLRADTKRGFQSFHERKDDQEALAERRKILDWVTEMEHSSQQDDFISRREPGSGKWFLDQAEYQDWLTSEGQTLFCVGIPGAGKTMITSMVIQELCDKYQYDTSVGIAYVYCNFKSKDEQTLENLLAVLLRQLLHGQDTLPEHVVDLYENCRRRRTKPTKDDMLDALGEVAKSLSKVYILVDALDECHDGDGRRRRLISYLQSLREDHKVNIFATSRFIPEITDCFQGDEVLEIRARSEDIQLYLCGQMFRLPNFVGRNATLQEEIKSAISSSVDGMFLLAQLHFESLTGKRSPKAIRTALLKLASGSDAYDHAYRNAMERIEGQVIDQKELARQILSWIICAKRPLKTIELQHALGVEIGESEIDEDNFSQIEDMISVCAGLVTVDEESEIIRLVHYTTQEYFDRTQNEWFPNAEVDLTEICTAYLSFDAFGTGFCTTETAFTERLQTYKLYDYASRNWGHHAKGASNACEQATQFLTMTYHVEASLQGWFKPGGRNLQPVSDSKMRQFGSLRSTALHVAAIFGIKTYVIHLLESTTEIDPKDVFGRTPLMHAVVGGHNDVVQYLLDSGANIEARTPDNLTSLNLAVQLERTTVVELLLQHKACTDVQDNIGCTALMDAARKGNEPIVRLLLNHGAAADLQDRRGLNALMHAIQNKKESIVRAMLEHSVNLDTTDRVGYTALMRAIEEEQEDVVRLLLDLNADTNIQDDEGETALIHAIRWGYEAIVKMLLDRNADVNVMDHEGDTALSHAIRRGSAPITVLLLDCGASVSSQNIGDWKVLNEPKRTSSDTVMKMLCSQSQTLNVVEGL